MKKAAAVNTMADQDYLNQREKNNIAVRKSREKARQKIKATKERVERLKKQNVELVNQLDLLNRELAFLKELFNAQCAKKGLEDTQNISFCNDPEDFDLFLRFQ